MLSYLFPGDSYRCRIFVRRAAVQTLSLVFCVGEVLWNNGAIMRLLLEKLKGANGKKLKS